MDNVTETAQNEIPLPHHKKNVYPIVRHVFLVVIVLIALAAIAFLMHQNGKSIYDKGV